MCNEDKNVYLNMLLVLDGLEDFRWKSFYDAADEVS